jgi:hypothetical protein
MRKTFIGTLLLAIFMTGTVAAAPSFLGPTGLIYTPTAETLNTENYSLSFYVMDDPDLNSLSFNYGLCKNVEIGLTRVELDPGNFSKTILNAKWQFIPEGNGRPALAFGISDVTDELDQTPYVVASQTLSNGLRVHYGIGDGLFGGVEKDIHKGTLMAEYDGDDLNVGARFNVARDVKINVGLKDLDRFYVGVSLTK